MHFHEGSDQIQPNTQTALGSMGISFDLRKWFKNVFQNFWGYPNAGISDRHDQVVGILFGAERYLPARFGILRRVVQYIRKHLSQADAIAIKNNWFFRNV